MLAGIVLSQVLIAHSLMQYGKVCETIHLPFCQCSWLETSPGLC